MKLSVLIRTGSFGPVHSPAVSGSPILSLSRNDSLSGVFSGERKTVTSPRICLHSDVNPPRDKNTIRRSQSADSNILRSDSSKSGYFLSSEAGRSPGSGVPGIESSVTIEREERRKMGAYYQEMLKSNPSDPLLLRNYGQFLHEVEKDMVRAEEYYCRAILASPGDGELLSLYGKLIWESQRDKDRAESYFNQAISASPDNSMVLGSFASFMWEAEEDEEDDAEFKSNGTTAQVSSAARLVPAF